MTPNDLARKFRDQERFAADYAPLYAKYFGIVAGWLEKGEAGETDPLVKWLLQAGAQRTPFEVTIVLAAALHRDVLAGEPAAQPLAAFYPTVGGDATAPGLEATLRQVVLARRYALTPFMQTANVQTNETGRGLAWLLPLHLTGWAAVHLIDLGASAGLNLLADKRHFRLVDAGSGHPLLDLGQGQPEQFCVQVHGGGHGLSSTLPPLPRILSRLGGDLFPFHLHTPADELMLMSYIWADHVPRLQRLREAIAARRAYTEAFQLEKLALPQEVEDFLTRHVSSRQPRHPVVIYNTYMTTYLPDKGASLPERIGCWAAAQPHPVLWLQWEPPPPPVEPPVYGWCAWTADYWQQQTHQHVHLGWVHPHGTIVELADGFANRLRFDTI